MSLDAITVRCAINAGIVAALMGIGSRVSAQGHFTEGMIGWTEIGTHQSSGPDPFADRFRSGPYIRGSIGERVGSRIDLRTDLHIVLFTLQTNVPVPCPSSGCPHPFYDDHTRVIGGLTESALVDLDPRGFAYVVGGAGLYDAETQVNSFHVGAFGGIGLRIPSGSHFRVLAEATWHGLAPEKGAPRWFMPLGVGLRF
jgi:hypothetical protein